MLSSQGRFVKYWKHNTERKWIFSQTKEKHSWCSQSERKEDGTNRPLFFTSSISGWGNRIRPICLSVCWKVWFQGVPNNHSKWATCFGSLLFWVNKLLLNLNRKKRLLNTHCAWCIKAGALSLDIFYLSPGKPYFYLLCSENEIECGQSTNWLKGYVENNEGSQKWSNLTLMWAHLPVPYTVIVGTGKWLYRPFFFFKFLAPPL